jgi:hypothetical protein
MGTGPLLRIVADQINGRQVRRGEIWQGDFTDWPAGSNTIFKAGIEYGIILMVETARKITVEIPGALLEKAQQASGAGITQTIRTGLELVAASETYKRLRQLRGKVRFTRTAAELKADR